METDLIMLHITINYGVRSQPTTGRHGGELTYNTKSQWFESPSQTDKTPFGHVWTISKSELATAWSTKAWWIPNAASSTPLDEDWLKPSLVHHHYLAVIFWWIHYKTRICKSASWRSTQILAWLENERFHGSRLTQYDTKKSSVNLVTPRDWQFHKYTLPRTISPVFIFDLIEWPIHIFCT